MLAPGFMNSVYAMEFRIFCPFSPHSAAFPKYLWQCIPLCLRWGLWVIRRFRVVWSKLFESRYSTLFYGVSDIKSFLTPLRLHEFEAMHSTLLAKGSEDRNKLESAIRVWLKQLEESYATLCCQFRIFSPFSFHTPAFTWICNHALH